MQRLILLSQEPGVRCAEGMAWRGWWAPWIHVAPCAGCGRNLIWPDPAPFDRCAGCVVQGLVEALVG